MISHRHDRRYLEEVIIGVNKALVVWHRVKIKVFTTRQRNVLNEHWVTIHSTLHRNIREFSTYVSLSGQRKILYLINNLPSRKTSPTTKQCHSVSCSVGVCLCIYVRTCMHVSMSVGKYVCTYVYICMYICLEPMSEGVCISITQHIPHLSHYPLSH